MAAFHTIPNVSTHSRLKAAAFLAKITFLFIIVSTHSRLKAAGSLKSDTAREIEVSTHSRLKAAGNRSVINFYF